MVDLTPEDEPAPTFTFTLPDGLMLAAEATPGEPLPPVEDNLIGRVSLGHSPRVSLAAGETFTTQNARLAARLRRDAHLVEVSS